MGPWQLISKLMSLSLPDNHLSDTDTRIVTQVVGGKKAFVRNAEIVGTMGGVENFNVVSFELCLGWQWCLWQGAGGDQQATGTLVMDHQGTRQLELYSTHCHYLKYKV